MSSGDDEPRKSRTILQTRLARYLTRNETKEMRSQTLQQALMALNNSIENLNNTIKSADIQNEIRYKSLKAELEGLSEKLGKKPSQDSVDEIKTDIETANKRLEVIINQTAPQKNLKGIGRDG